MLMSSFVCPFFNYSLSRDRLSRRRMQRSVDVSAQKTKSALVTEEITETNAFSTSAKVTIQCFETSSRNFLSTGMLTTAHSQLGRSGHS